jgi:hypothetical protein
MSARQPDLQILGSIVSVFQFHLRSVFASAKSDGLFGFDLLAGEFDCRESPDMAYQNLFEGKGRHTALPITVSTRRKMGRHASCG